MTLLTDNEWGKRRKASSGSTTRRPRRSPKAAKPRPSATPKAPKSKPSRSPKPTSTSTGNGWREFTSRWRWPLIGAAVLLVAAVIAAAVFIGRDNGDDGAGNEAAGASGGSVPVENTDAGDTEPMTLGAIAAAVDSLKTASSVTLTSELRNPPATVEISYYTDGRDGSGTISAKGQTGRVLVRDGRVFIDGGSAFWNAVGVRTSGEVSGWVYVPDAFDGQNIAPSLPRLASALAVKMSGVVGPGWQYRTADGTASVGHDGTFKNLRVGNLTTVPKVNTPVVNGPPGPVNPSFDLVPDGPSWVMKARSANAPASAPAAPSSPASRRPSTP